jgi:glycosyltransferase involved in cell wall biosynthesis
VTAGAAGPVCGPRPGTFGAMDPPDGQPSGSGRRRQLVGVLCTHRRPSAALDLLGRLGAQTRPPDAVVVVDNGDDARLAAEIEDRFTGPMSVTYVSAMTNLGPAGALRLGLDAIAPGLADDDLVLFLDDDDPPVDPSQLAVLEADLEALARSDPSVAGVGLSGGTLRPTTGRVAPVVGRDAVEEVDHLHGGYLPVYRARALLDVGGNDPSFFYGFEELELGRRLRLRGWRLVVLNDRMRGWVSRYPKRPRAEGGQKLLAVDGADLGWSRFHKERNLIRVLRRERFWIAILVTILTRHLAKPLLALPLHPRPAARRLVLGLRATVDGLRGRGGIDARYAPPTGTTEVRHDG